MITSPGRITNLDRNDTNKYHRFMVAEQARPRRLTTAGRNGEMTSTSVAVENRWVTETSNVTDTGQPESCTKHITDNSGGECRYNHDAPAMTEVTNSAEVCIDEASLEKPI